MPIKYVKGLHKTASIEVKWSPFWRSRTFVNGDVFLSSKFLLILLPHVKKKPVFQLRKRKEANLLHKQEFLSYGEKYCNYSEYHILGTMS